MFTKLLLRSVARTTVLGGLVAASLVATPALVTTAPEIRNVACAYPAANSTATSLSLRGMTVYGVNTVASAEVRDTTGNGTPAGSVLFRLYNPNGSVRGSWTRTLSGGEARLSLPKGLPAQATYSARAFYRPSDNCGSSSSVRKYLTVIQAISRTSVNAPNIRKGTKPRVGLSVGSRSQLNVTGKARILVKRRAVVVRKATVTLRGGTASRAFRKLRPGYYNVEVRYLGNRNFTKSKGTDDFRVRR